MHPTIPDGRYFIVKRRLWRCSNLALDLVQQRLVNELMDARRAVKTAKASAKSQRRHRIMLVRKGFPAGWYKAACL
ncbi:hypothetical protein D3M70_16760 [Pseudomonas sp. LS-2]|nr:hypothetical protein D3M70_16760 [Pseudomonas sp. LS-2]